MDIPIDTPLEQEAEPVQAVCGACGAHIGVDVDRWVRSLLSKGLDQKRTAHLAEMYAGIPPETLCSGCFLTTLQILNQALGEVA